MMTENNSYFYDNIIIQINNTQQLQSITTKFPLLIGNNISYNYYYYTF